MKSLFRMIFSLSHKLLKLKCRIRGYYYSKVFRSCGKVPPYINEYVAFSCPKYIDCGSNVTINPQVYFAAKGGIVIGDNVAISAGAKILSSSLNVIDGVVQKRHVHKAVRLGNNVWIGAGAVVCPGVTIGDNSIVAAGAVVTKDMPSGSLIGGVPAKVIRPLAPQPEA
ncbi:MAG: acyltransferase [Victivallales bacterium]|nr:acyltransferase [Victivallales bacterium]